MKRKEAFEKRPDIHPMSVAISVDQLLHNIYNDIDSQVCGKCQHYKEAGCGNIIEHCIFPLPKDFGCNRFVNKD